MKKVFFILIPFILAGGAFAAYYFFFAKDTGKGALQVTAVPQSNVYLDGQLIGKTPLCKCDAVSLLPTGEHTIRLVPLDAASAQDSFEQKITINKSVLTVVDRTFGSGATSQGSIINLIPSSNPNAASISVASFPSDVHVVLDGNAVGDVPLTLNNVTPSDHELILLKTGYKDKDIRIHAVNGYALSVLVFLGIDPDAIASSAGQVAPAASVSATPVQEKVTILQTPTGFLRVRSDPSLGAAEIAQVKPGESYDLVHEENGWYQITLSDSKTGWISASYATKQ